MFLARSVAGASLNAIAQEFGGRDHTSVLYAIRCAEQRLQEDAALARIVQELRAELMASSIAYRPGRA
jgi:chromosomal replication initiator protein